jgi:hypothetical protein
MEGTSTTVSSNPTLSSGEKTKSRDMIAAIPTLQTIEHEHRPANRGRPPEPGPRR